MSHHVELLPDAPILLVSTANPFDFRNEPTAWQRSIAEIQAGSSGPMCFILDTRGLQVSFSDLVVALGHSLRGQRPAGFDESRFVFSVLVGDHDLLHFATQSVEQAQYGGRRLAYMESMDEALAACRAALRQAV